MKGLVSGFGKGFVKYLPAVVAAVVLGGAVFAGEGLIQGQDSSGSTRYVLVDSTGRIVTTTDTSGSSASSGTTHGACTVTAMTIGATATNCPGSPLASRGTLTVQMRTSGQTLTVRTDGSAATTTTGVDLGNFDTFVDNLAGNVNASCICSAAGCDVRVIECP